MSAKRLLHSTDVISVLVYGPTGQHSLAQPNGLGWDKAIPAPQRGRDTHGFFSETHVLIAALQAAGEIVHFTQAAGLG